MAYYADKRRVILNRHGHNILKVPMLDDMVNYHVSNVASGIVGPPRSWVRGMFGRIGNKQFGADKFLDYTLEPHEEERLQRLQERLHVPFDETRVDHQASLTALWRAAYPDVTLKGLISEQWKDMGWQGSNPSTDFRKT